MKYSFLMGYYKRPVHLHNSLVSFMHHYHNRYDYEIVLGIDIKNNADDLKHLSEVIANFPSINFNAFVFDHPEARTDFNHARILNECARRAIGEFFIVSAPEIFHTTDILGGLDKIYSEKTRRYVVCTVGGSDWPTELIEKYEDFKYHVFFWYQHPKLRDKRIYFLASMPADFYWEIGGSNEAYAKGMTHEDTSFRMRVMYSGIEVLTPEELVAIHQQHDSIFQLFGKKLSDQKIIEDLARIRQEMTELEALKNKEGFDTSFLRDFIKAKEEEANTKYGAK